MADELRVKQEIIQVEWTDPPETRIEALIVQVEWTEGFRYTGDLAVSIIPDAICFRDPYLFTGDITVGLTPVAEVVGDRFCTGDLAMALGLAADSIYDPPGVFTCIGEISVAMGVAAESRHVPSFAYLARIAAALQPEAESQEIESLIFVHEGNLTVEMCDGLQGDLWRDSLYAPIIPGRDNYSGMGVLDVSFLDEEPPFYCARDAIPLKLDPTAASVTLYAQYTHVGEGGFAVSGDPTYAFIPPPKFSEMGSVGVKVGGEPRAAFIPPPVLSFAMAGGVKAGGTSTVRYVQPAVPPVYSFVGQGGAAAGGEPVLTVKRPATLFFMGEGGARVGGLSFPDVVIIRPMVIPGWDKTKVAVAGKGGVEISGAAEVRLTRPSRITIPVTPIAVVVSGESGLVIMRPQTIEILGDGGLVIGEEPLPEQCDTWVLSDTKLEPSLYTGFHFNSYALFQGRGFAAGADGIYLLEGADDTGRPIHSGVRIGKTNFGLAGPKRLRFIRMNEGNEDAEVRVATGGKAGFFEHSPGGWKISRDLQDSEFTIDVAGFAELSHLEVVPLVLVRK